MSRSSIDVGDIALAATDVAAIAGPTPLPLKIAAAGHLVNFVRRLF